MSLHASTIHIFFACEFLHQCCKTCSCPLCWRTGQPTPRSQSVHLRCTSEKGQGYENENTAAARVPWATTIRNRHLFIFILSTVAAKETLPRAPSSRDSSLFDMAEQQTLLMVLAVLLAASIRCVLASASEQMSCSDKKGVYPSSCAGQQTDPPASETGSDLLNASDFTATATKLCPTNQPLPQRSFVPAAPRGPGSFGDREMTGLYNNKLRLEVLLRGETSNDGARRADRSWRVQGLNVTRLSAAHYFGSAQLQELLEPRRHDPNLILLFVDEA